MRNVLSDGRGRLEAHTSVDAGTLTAFMSDEEAGEEEVKSGGTGGGGCAVP